MFSGDLLITGSSGLIGSEMVSYFAPQFERVVGIDNNLRQEFFGPEGNTLPVLKKLRKEIPNFEALELDIRDRQGINEVFKSRKFDAIIHCAAQPSHDLAASIPVTDFEVNALGTLNLLEGLRLHNPEAAFVFLSTNKVYGDRPNQIELLETETRYEYAHARDAHGISEEMSIDQCIHSLFGVSKAAADLMVQEYGRNFGLKTVCLRGGCLTGPNHRGTMLHGFLSYLVRANITHQPYTVFGYKGKQVRDNIHSLDVARCVEEILKKPNPGEVFNLGGGRDNSCSVLEAMAAIENITGIRFEKTYRDEPRTGDHICYYTDLRKLKRFYPKWKITRSLDQIIAEIYQAWKVDI
jgi:CDP-paratose 2-epimerase